MGDKKDKEIYAHFVRILPMHFDIIQAVSVDDIGHHFMDDEGYEPLTLQVNDNYEDKSKIIGGKVQHWAITVSKQYLFLHEDLDIEEPWFQSLIKQFTNNPDRYIIRFSVTPDLKFDLFLDSEDSDIEQVEHIDQISYTFFSSIMKYKQFVVNAVYFLQASIVIEK